ncbi:NAD(P)-binding domain-containing protein [Nocardia macrotermitis]|uniref:2-hydroxy-3-oxopropionate reductase n=1 Tax=Nocardia macrotermitis TaxID=2585198 RepID=A0A7K0D7A5_9NOCA|nr:NAD(P)-binding domain-containing protein [Nocardia macrotermitis]MQY21587.1 2-hydroxy-3-oxopropionate reductase [Nocardia macrotermitis]
MTIGFIGLGHMGFPMARRLADAGHQLVVYDTRAEILDAATAFGATAASSARDVADRAETVLASLPSLQASADVATGADGVVHGSRIRRFVDLSTVGSAVAQRNQRQLGSRGITALDAPVSGGVAGATNGTCARGNPR